VRVGQELGVPMELVDAVQRVNARQRVALVEKVLRHFGGADGREDAGARAGAERAGERTLAGRTFAVWGLAFKPNTDDVREAPAIATIQRLLAHGAAVRAHDPVAVDCARAVLGERPGLAFTGESYAALDGADALLVCTEWNEYRVPDFEQIRARLKTPVVFDGRNVYDPAKMRALGFTYQGIGRG
jgi:UDPglucose 6-dehydrogenase